MAERMPFKYIGKHRLYRGTPAENRGRIARPAETE